jgi:hypothetical protein
MSLTQFSRMAAAIVLCCTMAGQVAAAEAVVLLSATAPGYTPGMVIGPKEQLRLPDGASVTLLLRSGQMLRLRGPLETSIEQAEPSRSDDSASALAEAFRLRGVDASAVGGSRTASLGRRMRGPGDVSVEIERSGTWCVGASDTVWLMRPVTELSELGLRRRRNLRRIEWPPGVARVEWPGDLPFEDGDTFEVLADGQTLGRLTFRRLASVAASESAEIARGFLLGCREQYQAALRRLARASLAPELWVSTERGRSPVYAPGERIELRVLADTDGWLYCVTTRSDGVAAAVFPAGAIGSEGLSGRSSASLPGDRRNVAFPAGPRGVQTVKCWLADRDIGPELPHALFDGSGARLPDRVAAELDATFAGISNRLAQASLDIQVE